MKRIIVILVLGMFILSLVGSSLSFAHEGQQTADTPGGNNTSGPDIGDNGWENPNESAEGGFMGSSDDLTLVNQLIQAVGALLTPLGFI